METPGSAACGTKLSRYQVRPYRANGGFEAGGVMMLVSALAIAGAGLGFAAHWIAQYFYLIFLFPAAIGLGLGAVGVRMIRQGRVRNPWIGGLAGFVGGAMAMFMMHYFDYQEFKGMVDKLPPALREVAQLAPQERMAAVKPDLSPADRQVAESLLRMASVRNMLDYMNFAAEQGVKIKRAAHSGGKPMNLGFWGSYVYWVLEILIVAGLTFLMVHTAAVAPYCAKCGRWKQAKTIGAAGGNMQSFVTAAVAGDLEAAKAAKGTDADGPLKVTVACCDGCVGEGDVDVKLELATVNKKGETSTKKLAHLTYPAEALAAWVGLMGENKPR